jgi:hypothetical protein
VQLNNKAKYIGIAVQYLLETVGSNPAKAFEDDDCASLLIVYIMLIVRVTVGS